MKYRDTYRIVIQVSRYVSYRDSSIVPPLISAGSNGVDIEVSKRHTVSVSNYRRIKASTDDGMVHF